jgi:hypothetical protein
MRRGYMYPNQQAYEYCAPAGKSGTILTLYDGKGFYSYTKTTTLGRL